MVVIAAGIAKSDATIKMCVITAGMKKYKAIVKNKRKKHDKIVLLEKAKLNTIEVLIFKAFIDSILVIMNFFH